MLFCKRCNKNEVETENKVCEACNYELDIELRDGAIGPFYHWRSPGTIYSPPLAKSDKDIENL